MSSRHSAGSPTSTPAASALPPAMPPATGIALRSTTRTSGLRPALLREREHGLPGQVALVGGHPGHPVTVHLDAGLVGRRDGDLVEQADRVEHRDEVVVAVVAAVADGEVQVDLGRDTHGDRGRHDW